MEIICLDENTKQYYGDIMRVAKKVSPVDRNALVEGTNMLGKGIFGEVFLLFRGEDRTACALKLATNQSVAAKQSVVAKQLVNEARILSELKHSNIVALEGVSFIYQKC